MADLPLPTIVSYSTSVFLASTFSPLRPVLVSPLPPPD
jgi:hypothetical protein